MHNDDIAQRVQVVFQDIFDNPNLIISPGMTAKDVDDWDSFNHINLVMAIEKTFKIRFTIAEVGRLANVGDLFKLIESKLNQ